MHINDRFTIPWTEMGNTKNKNKPKTRKKPKRKSALNGRLGGRPGTSQSQHEVISDPDSDLDCDETSSDHEWQAPAGQSTRIFGRNKRSMFFMSHRFMLASVLCLKIAYLRRRLYLRSLTVTLASNL